MNRTPGTGARNDPRRTGGERFEGCRAFSDTERDALYTLHPERACVLFIDAARIDSSCSQQITVKLKSLVHSIPQRNHSTHRYTPIHPPDARYSLCLPSPISPVPPIKPVHQQGGPTQRNCPPTTPLAQLTTTGAFSLACLTTHHTTIGAPLLTSLPSHPCPPN